MGRRELGEMVEEREGEDEEEMGEERKIGEMEGEKRESWREKR